MVQAGAARGASSSPGLGPDYRRLWVASTVSNLGDGVRLAALPLLVASLTTDPGPVAGLRAAATLPWLLFALLAGVVVDRVDRRRLLWTVQAGRMALVLALGLAVAADADPAVLLGLAYLVAFGLGTGEVLFDNAAQALLPALVPADRLQVANGRLYAAQEVANRLAGPPLGGVLFAAAAAAPFLLDATSFAVAAAVLLLLAAPTPAPAVDGGGRATPGAVDGPAHSASGAVDGAEHSASGAVDGAEHSASGSATLPLRGATLGAGPVEAAPAGGVRREVAEGLAWLWRDRRLRALAVWTGVFNLTSAATSAIVVLYALQVLGLDEAGFGVLLAAGALGGVAGGALGPRLARRLGDGRSLVAITLGGAAANLLLAAGASPVVAAVALAGLSLGAMWGAVIAVSLRQAVVPDRLLGRVNSAYRLLAWGTQPLGAALGGGLAAVAGLRAPYLLAGAVLGAMAAVMARDPRFGRSLGPGGAVRP